jgi:hypothetical protein
VNGHDWKTIGKVMGRPCGKLSTCHDRKVSLLMIVDSYFYAADVKTTYRNNTPRILTGTS